MATQLRPPPVSANPPPADAEGAMMGFFEHLDELRVRLFRAMLSLAVGMVLSLIVVNPVIAYIAASSGITLRSISPTETIGVFFRVTLMLGAILASPFITYQLLMFIIPGLTRVEKRWVLGSIPATTVLFLFGVIFTWFVLMPAYNTFLNGFQANVIKPSWTADNYFSFVTLVLFWHGAAFETPIVFYVLARIGLVSARQMLRFWRHAIVGSAIFAGFIAPTYDPVTMIAITALLFALFLFSVALVAIAVPGGWRGRVRGT